MAARHEIAFHAVQDCSGAPLSSSSREVISGNFGRGPAEPPFEVSPALSAKGLFAAEFSDNRAVGEMDQAPCVRQADDARSWKLLLPERH